MGQCINAGGGYFQKPVTSLQPPAHAGSSLADFSTLKMEAILPPKRPFTQDLHGAISQKTEFFKPK
jgi:hypothetical protein